MSRFGAPVLAAVLAAALLAPAGAEAEALRFHDCGRSARAFECATLRVPLDRQGAVRGHVDLRVLRERRAPRHAGTLVALAGGPGQGAADFAAFYPLSLSAARDEYRIVVVDQRGTGRSGPLRCPRLQRIHSLDPPLRALTAGCARELGPRRRFYSTTDSVDDLEALRRALGVPKLAFAGTSYGTYVAMQYARRYPARTDRLVLDSSVGPGGVDPLLRDSWGPLPRILAQQCARRACEDITTDPVADLRALSAQLESAPLRGPVVDARGRTRTRTLTAPALANLILSGDLNGHLQAAVPAAVRSARNGDPAPLLRLIRPASGPPYPVRDLSWGLYVATTCADTRLSYPLTTPPAERQPAIDAALAASPDASLGPFSRAVVGHLSIDEQCAGWPAESLRGPVEAPLPRVPTLVLGGSLDIRTPLENDRAVVAEIPGAQLVTVPGNGHDVIDTDVSGCVQRALKRFFGDRRVGDPCAGVDNAVPPQPVAPTSLEAVTPAPGTPGDRGRVLAAAVGTVDDTREALLQIASSGLHDRGGGGLRGGTWRLAGETSFTMRRVSWVPGVRVSGRIDSRVGRYQGRVTVDAPGKLDGTLRFDRRTGVTGRIGGERVRLAARHARGAVPPSILR
ncbi:MAG TPA: alpha/beta fold hydrolase [Capillimicrobium sp.]|nr:alpha/beta fold hydrolase [Capillimicrobium sp.]